MPRPTIASLQADVQLLQRRISVALKLHVPVTNPAHRGVICRVCRDPYPCDTAIALGARQ